LIENLKRLWPAGKLKKDHFLIMILVGILFLVIIWPTGESASSDGESGLLDSFSGIMNSSANDDDAEIYQANIKAMNTDEKAKQTELAAYTEYLEAKLEAALSTMEGAGQTKVMITLNTSAETIIEKDAPTSRAGSTEVDSSGGSRNTTDIETGQATVYYTNSAGQQIPYPKKTIQPLIEGVLVVTQGGGNEKIIQHITEAIMALFGVDEHKIKIVKMIS
jgi:stage III sporulation protein AG